MWSLQLAWIITIALFAIAKNRLSDWTDGVLRGDYGNAMWMGLAACVRCHKPITRPDLRTTC